MIVTDRATNSDRWSQVGIGPLQLLKQATGDAGIQGGKSDYFRQLWKDSLAEEVQDLRASVEGA